MLGLNMFLKLTCNIGCEVLGLLIWVCHTLNVLDIIWGKSTKKGRYLSTALLDVVV